MTQSTKPSAGALRAARKLNPGRRLYCSPNGEREVAHVIDRETGVAELLEAATWTRDTLRAMVSDRMIEKEVRGLLLVRCTKLEQAIAKCEGNNSGGHDL